MMEARIQSTVIMPNGLPCKKEVLGCEFNIKVDELNGILAFPRLPNDYREILRKEGFSETKLLRPQNANIELCYNDIQWGNFSNSQGNSNVDCLAIWFPCNFNECEQIANKLSDKINPYIDKFILFLEIISGNAFSRKTGNSIHIETKELNHIQFLYLNEKNIRDFSPKEIDIKLDVIFNSNENFINHDTVLNAIKLTNNGYNHNLAHILLRDSIYYRVNNENRKAILDASTAIEIALTRRIKSEFQVKNISEKLQESLLKKYHSISGRIELFQSLEIDLPCKIEEYKTFLAKIRNKAIHAGHTPSTEEARRVIEVAKMTVNEFCEVYE